MSPAAPWDTGATTSCAVTLHVDWRKSNPYPQLYFVSAWVTGCIDLWMDFHAVVDDFGNLVKVRP
jgi:hypothetical protein